MNIDEKKYRVLKLLRNRFRIANAQKQEDPHWNKDFYWDELKSELPLEDFEIELILEGFEEEKVIKIHITPDAIVRPIGGEVMNYPFYNIYPTDKFEAAYLQYRNKLQSSLFSRKDEVGELLPKDGKERDVWKYMKNLQKGTEVEWEDVFEAMENHKTINPKQDWKVINSAIRRINEKTKMVGIGRVLQYKDKIVTRLI